MIAASSSRLVGGTAAWPLAPQLKARYSNRLDHIPRELDTLLPAEQLQQNEHPFMRTQGSEQTNVILQRALQDPHARTRFEPQLW